MLKGAAAVLVASVLTLSAAPVSAQTMGEFIDNLEACYANPITADAIAPCTWVIDRADHFRGSTYPDFDIVARFMRAIAFRVSGNINAGEPDYQASVPYFLAHLNDYRFPTLIAREQNARCWERAIHNTDLSAARAMCDDAIRLGSEDVVFFLDSRGLVGLQQRQWEAAYRDYNDAIAAGGGDRASGLYGRGLAALQLGNIADGQDDLAQAREIDPGIDAKYASYGQRVDPRFARAETLQDEPQTEVAEASEVGPVEGGLGTCATTPDETARNFDSEYSAWLAGYPQHSDRLGAQAQYQYMYFIAEEALSRIESARTCLGTHYETLRAGHTRTRDSARDGCVALSSTSTCRPTYPW